MAAILPLHGAGPAPPLPGWHAGVATWILWRVCYAATVISAGGLGSSPGRAIIQSLHSISFATFHEKVAVACCQAAVPKAPVLAQTCSQSCSGRSQMLGNFAEVQLDSESIITGNSSCKPKCAVLVTWTKFRPQRVLHHGVSDAQNGSTSLLLGGHGA